MRIRKRTFAKVRLLWLSYFDVKKKKTETLRGQVTAEVEEEEEVGLRVRRSGPLRQRGHPPEVPTTCIVVIFSASVLRLRALSYAVAAVSVPLLIRSLLARDIFMGSHFLVAARP